jgi:thiosulfate reductase cytochrome b subunit
MSERIYLLPLWLRLWHWLNALLIITLCITGFSLHFAGPDAHVVEFSLAVRIHNIAGVSLAILYFVFVIANALSGNWWQYVPKPPGILHRCWLQVRYYCFGVFKGEPEPFPVTKEANFNALQSLIYWFIVYVNMPITVVSGLIYLTPLYVPREFFGFDGHLLVALIHYLSAVLILLYLIAHMYLATMGATVTSMLKTMITGWHETD